MLKNCKKTMAFLLAAALLLSVTACGAGQKTENGSGGAQVSGGTASTETAASVKPEEQAQTSKTGDPAAAVWDLSVYRGQHLLRRNLWSVHGSDR